MLASVFRLGAWLSGLFLAAIAVSTFVDVTVRWLTGWPIIGVYEINQMLMLAATFLALPYLHYQRMELSVDILRQNARGLVAKVIYIVDVILATGFMFLLAWTAGIDFVAAVQGGYRAMGMIEIPTAIPLGITMIGAALTVLALLTRRYREPSSGDV